MKKNLILSITIILFFLIVGFAKNDMSLGLSERSKMMYGFINKTGKYLEKKYRMSQCSVGGGVKEGIWLMTIGFERDSSPLTEEDSRRLIISCVNDFLVTVNNDEGLRPFLEVYPFTAKNLEFTIFNSKIDGTTPYFPYIYIVTNNQGKIGFLTKDESQEFGYKTEKYETYEEAVAILKNEPDLK